MIIILENDYHLFSCWNASILTPLDKGECVRPDPLDKGDLGGLKDQQH